MSASTPPAGRKKFITPSHMIGLVKTGRRAHVPLSVPLECRLDDLHDTVINGVVLGRGTAARGVPLSAALEYGSPEYEAHLAAVQDRIRRQYGLTENMVRPEDESPSRGGRESGATRRRKAS